MKLLNKLLLLALISITFSNCVSRKKINEMKQALNTKMENESKFIGKIDKLHENRNEKFLLGEIDDNSSGSITNILEKQKIASSKWKDSLNILNEQLYGKKRIKIKNFKNIIKVITYNNNNPKTSEESIEFVNQLLKQQTFIKFNTAAFFEAGGFDIPSEKIEDAKKAFSPVVDSLFVFIKKFPKYKLEASIIINGYADGQGFSPSELVNQLTKNIGKDQATKEELNQELSRLRSEGVSQIIVGIYNDKVKEITSNYQFNTRFIKIGKGEEYPNKKIDNYQIDDERRRIVVIYWNAIPID